MVAKKTVREFIIHVDDNGTIVGTAKKLDTLDKSINKTSKSSNEMKRNQEGVGKNSLNNSKGFAREAQGLGGLVRVYATVAANVFALSSAYLVLKRNSNLQIMIEASRDLSNSTGKNYAAVARSLQEITHGALDMTAAMQAANLGLSGGATVKQLGDIATIATKAAQVLGRSVPEAVTRMTQAVIKGEPELVDEFGIILRVTTATEKYAEAHGLAVKDLTAFQKSQAIVNQLVEQGNAKFADAAIRENPYEKLSAGLVDTGNKLLALVGGPIGSAVSFVADNSGLIVALITGIVAKIGSLALPALHDFSATASTSFKEASISASKEIGTIEKKILDLNSTLRNSVQVMRDVQQERSKTLITGGVDTSKIHTKSKVGQVARGELPANDPAVSKAVLRAITPGKLKQAEAAARKAGKDIGFEFNKGFILTLEQAKELRSNAASNINKGAKVAFEVGATGGVTAFNKALATTELQARKVSLSLLQIKKNAATAFSNILSSKFSFKLLADESTRVASSINMGNGFLAKMVQGTAFASLGMAKLATSAVSVLSSLSVWGFAALAAWQTLKAIGSSMGFISKEGQKFQGILEDTTKTLEEQQDITDSVLKKSALRAEGLTEQLAKQSAITSAMEGSLSISEKLTDNITLAAKASRTFGTFILSGLFGANTAMDDLIEKLESATKIQASLAPAFVTSSSEFKKALQEQAKAGKALADGGGSSRSGRLEADLLKANKNVVRILRDGAQAVSAIYSESKDAVTSLNKQASKFKTDLINSSESAKELNNIDKITRQYAEAAKLGEKAPDLQKMFDSASRAILGITDKTDTAGIEKALIFRATELEKVVKQELAGKAKLKAAEADLAFFKLQVSKGYITSLDEQFKAERAVAQQKIEALKQEIRLNDTRVKGLTDGSGNNADQISFINQSSNGLRQQIALQKELQDQKTKGIALAEIDIEQSKRKIKLLNLQLEAIKVASSINKAIISSRVSTRSQAYDASVSEFGKARATAGINRTKLLESQTEARGNVISASASGRAPEDIALLKQSLNNVNLSLIAFDETEKIAIQVARDNLLTLKSANTSVFDPQALDVMSAKFKQTTREANKSTISHIDAFVLATNTSIDKFSDQFVENLMDGNLSLKDTFKGIGEVVADTFKESLAESLKEQMSSSFKTLIAGFLEPDPVELSQLSATNNLAAATWALNGTMTAGTTAGTTAESGSGILGSLLSIGASFFSPSAGFSGATSVGVESATSSFLPTADSFAGMATLAEGGITRGTSIAGEKGPEAVVPLPDGRTIPVNMSGANQSSADTYNISVAVDESGSQQEDSGSGKGNEMGRLITVAITDEIAKQKRPGGLLYAGARR